jgi:hypothetical protein
MRRWQARLRFEKDAPGSKDVALSRLKQGFESPRERQQHQKP